MNGDDVELSEIAQWDPAFIAKIKDKLYHRLQFRAAARPVC